MRVQPLDPGDDVHLNLYISLAGLIVGLVVGMTGMGGGALMTPILVLIFGIQPLAAVSSDLVAAVVMKPVGGAVHASKGTVNYRIVGWLALGSIPSAFLGVVLLRAINSDNIQDDIKLAMGSALVLAVVGMGARALIAIRRHEPAVMLDEIVPVAARPLPTLAVGIFGGLIVGMTSVGSGSLMIVLMMLLYPKLSMRQLVGTDLVQAVPLVASAALGQILFGDFKLGLTTSLLIGSIPGVFVGARLSATIPGGIVRWVLAIVLAGSAVKLLGANNVTLAVVTLVGVGLWAFVGLVLPKQRARTTVDQTQLGRATAV